MTNYTPAEVFHPGEMLADELAERGMTFTELAEKSGIPIEDLAQLGARLVPMTDEMANGLERALGVSAQFWSLSWELYIQGSK